MRMMRIRTAVIGTLVAAALGSTAQAADILPVISPVTPTVVVSPPALRGFDWRGPYVGATAGAFEPFDGPFLAAGGLAGFNITRGRLVAGVEVDVYGIFFGDYVNLQVIGRGRAGVTLGQRGRVLLYGALGVGHYGTIGGGENGWYLQPAAGVELALGDRLSLRTEVEAFQYFGALLQIDQFQLTGGLVFHLGN